MPYTANNRLILFFHGVVTTLAQADCFLQGLYVERDLETALMLYNQAVADGVTSAHFKLGLFHQHYGNPDLAGRHYYNAFLNGYLHARDALEELLGTHPLLVSAKFYLACIFEREESWSEAVSLFRALATVEKHPEAMFRLGILHQRERRSKVDSSVVIPKDALQKLNWYKQAALLEFSEAISALRSEPHLKGMAFLYLAEVYETGARPNPAEALECYLRAAAFGNLDASYRLAGLNERGELSLPVNKKEAFDYYLIAARHAHPEALNDLERLVRSTEDSSLEFRLAIHYHDFLDNKVLGRYWFKKAADRKNAEALNALEENSTLNAEFAYAIAQLYENTGEINLKFSFKYYLLAAQRNYEDSLTQLERLAATLNDSEIDYKLAEHYYFFIKNKARALLGYKKSADKGFALAASRLVEISTMDSGFAFSVAEAYENADASDELIATHNRKEACQYYFLAAKQKHKGSLDALERLITVLLDHELEFELAGVYYQVMKEKNLSLMWYKKADEGGNLHVRSRLEEISKKDSEFAYRVAQLYEADGNYGVAKTHFKFAAPQNKEAAFRLGQLYEEEALSTPTALTHAFDYYLMAAKQGYLESLSSLERIIVCLNDSKREFELAEIYYTVVKNGALSLKWYTKSVAKFNAEAHAKLIEISKTDAEFSFDAAKLIEEESVALKVKNKNAEAEKLAEIAFYCSLLAIDNHHEIAEIWLESRASEGNPVAQHYIGLVKYITDRDERKAVYWFMQSVEQGYELSLNYFKNANFSLPLCLEIAAQYEQGCGVKENIDMAINFYTKAYHLGDKRSALVLGRLYEKKIELDESNREQACRYYLVAVKNGYNDALSPLKNLSKAASQIIKLQVLDLYPPAPLDRTGKLLEWKLRTVQGVPPGAARVASSGLFSGVSTGAASGAGRGSSVKRKVRALGVPAMDDFEGVASFMKTLH